MVSAESKKIGQLLLEKGYIDQFQLDSALGYQKRWGKKLGQCLVEMGFLSESKLAHTLSAIFQLPTIDLDRTRINALAINSIPQATVNKYSVVPVLFEQEGHKKRLFLATADPSNILVVDEISFSSGYRVSLLIATYSGIDRAIRRYYMGEELTLPHEAVEPITIARRPGDKNDDRMELIQEGEIKVVQLTEDHERGVAKMPSPEPSEVPEQPRKDLSDDSRFTTQVVSKDQLKKPATAPAQEADDAIFEVETNIASPPLPAPATVRKTDPVTETKIMQADDLLADLDEDGIDGIFADKISSDAFQAIKKTRVEVSSADTVTRKFEADKTGNFTDPQTRPAATAKQAPVSPLNSLLAILQQKGVIDAEEKRLVELSSQKPEGGALPPHLQMLMQKLAQKGVLSPEEIKRIGKKKDPPKNE